MRREPHIRLTPSQKRLLDVIRSFGRPATEREIALRAARRRGRLRSHRRMR